MNVNFVIWTLWCSKINHITTVSTVDKQNICEIVEVNPLSVWEEREVVCDIWLKNRRNFKGIGRNKSVLWVLVSFLK